MAGHIDINLAKSLDQLQAVKEHYLAGKRGFLIQFDNNDKSKNNKSQQNQFPSEFFPNETIAMATKRVS